MDYEMKRISEIRPYENNPRNNEKSVEKVASSIREFGFLQPIVCDGDGVILAGHTRYEAAKRLGLETVPVIYAKDLTEGQAKAYRIVDNKVGESSEWVEELLGKELEAILLEAPQIEPADFGFTSGAEIRRRKSWENAGKRCGTDLDIRIREKNGFLYTSFFTTGGEGKLISEIKKNPEMAELFAENLADYITRTIGGRLSGGGWCLATTPRRRHKDGFHFSSEVCRKAAGILGIPFREEIAVALTRARVDPKFELVKDPEEHNVILYDDIMTTGMTMKKTRELLFEKGHAVWSVVSIRNQ